MKYKKSTLNRKDIPTGSFSKLMLKHSFLDSSNEYGVVWKGKKFFNFDFLPSLMNIEIEGVCSVANNPRSILKNLRGFRSVDYFSPHD